MLATVMAKQMCTPSHFVHRCMINSSVKQVGWHLHSSLKPISTVVFEL